MKLKKLTERLNKMRGKLPYAGRVLEGEIHDIVAIKTGELDRSIRTGRVEDIPLGKKVEVGSFGVEYAKYVDVARKDKNYHRKGVVVYRGPGQEYLGRALEAKKNEIYKILTS